MFFPENIFTTVCLISSSIIEDIDDSSRDVNYLIATTEAEVKKVSDLNIM